MVEHTKSVRTRQAFSVVNSGQDESMRAESVGNGSSECGGMEFTREVVEALLAENMKVKNKYDHKGKCEQMAEYIRKLRLCIRSFLELEESYLLEQKKLRDLLESAYMKCAEIDTNEA